MKSNDLPVCVRLVVIYGEKVLVQHRKKKDFYHYIGGHVEFGETLRKACEREAAEECKGAKFTFEKILYIRDFIQKEENKHIVELFILGKFKNHKNLEGHKDPEHPDGSVWLTWLNIHNLPENLLPHDLSAVLLKDYKKGFKNEGKYIEKIK